MATRKQLPLAALLIVVSASTFCIHAVYGRICDGSSLQVIQGRTGGVVEGQPEWEVKIKNTCNCTLLHVKLSCSGFSTVRDVDPKIFKIIANDQDHCLINDGKPVHAGSTVHFYYAWLTPYDLPPFSARANCTA